MGFLERLCQRNRQQEVLPQDDQIVQPLSEEDEARSELSARILERVQGISPFSTSFGPFFDREDIASLVDHVSRLGRRNPPEEKQ